MSNTLERPAPSSAARLAPDRRRQDRILTRLPIRIVSIDGDLASYPGVCTNLSRGGIGFETDARIEVGKVVEFEFTQVPDKVLSYWVKILFRQDRRYGGYYVNDDGSDIRPPN